MNSYLKAGNHEENKYLTTKNHLRGNPVSNQTSFTLQLDVIFHKHEASRLSCSVSEFVLFIVNEFVLFRVSEWLESLCC